MYVVLCGAFFTLISVSLWSYYSLRVHVRSAQTPKKITMSCPRYQLRTTLPRILCKLHLIGRKYNLKTTCSGFRRGIDSTGNSHRLLVSYKRLWMEYI
ncbi:hypothetical protein F4604DRAFT_1711535 [Suillus subluteus]|nr:hypothetical protein F4604DRAFT_1711535 [Suillus subluteus]